MTLSRPEPTLTGGDFQCRHCRLLAGSSPSLPDGSNPSAAIVQSASDVQCSRLLKTTACVVMGCYLIPSISQSVFQPNSTWARIGEAERARRQASVAERVRYGVLSVLAGKASIARFSICSAWVAILLALAGFALVWAGHDLLLGGCPRFCVTGPSSDTVAPDRRHHNKDKHPITDALLDKLLANYQKLEDLIGTDELIKQLTKKLVERALDAEMTHHLGHDRH